MGPMRLLFITYVLIFLLGSCSETKQLVTIHGDTMGTYYRVVLYSDDDSKSLKKEIDRFLQLFNNIFSTYEKRSEISRINNSNQERFSVSDSMKKLMKLSLEISQKSRGHFDITVGTLVNLWGFGPDGKRGKPTQDQIAQAKELIGYHKLDLKKNLLKRPAGLSLDMSAIAKGFGVDELVKFLEFKGYGNLLVEIGGEVRARGKKQDGGHWRVGIEGPSKKLGQKIAKVVSLHNLSMATSGSYRNYKKYGDEIFGHTIDPKTGYPIKHKTISVTVVSEYCADADAWATALMSMGHEVGMDLVNKLDLMAYFQYEEDGQLLTKISSKFEKL